MLHSLIFSHWLGLDLGVRMSQLDGISVLITGGTGSLGKSLVEFVLKETKVRRIAIFSRDALKFEGRRT
jgi:FlaA1/EpsC-like NDP-sugar epimerase